MDILVLSQANWLTQEQMVQVPTWLSNTEFVNFIHASIDENANIINLINLDQVNRQKTTENTDGVAKKSFDRPERRSDSRPRFDAASRPYNRWRGGFGAREEKPSGWYASRSPRDWARPPRAGFGTAPKRWDSRSSRGNGYEAGKARSTRPFSRWR